MEAQFELSFACGEASLSVRHFRAREQISAPYEIDVVAVSRDHTIDLEAIVGQGTLLAIRSGNGRLRVPERTWSGVCAEIAQVKAEEERGALGLSTYALRIVPRLWLLSHNREQRIFQRVTIPEILQAVLKEWDVEVQLRLERPYRKLDYVVQYGESDLAFLSRLCERAGIAYYFDFTGGSKGVLTLADRPELRSSVGPIRFNDNQAERSGDEHVSALRLNEKIATGRVTLRDHDFRRPSHELAASPRSATPEDAYELYGYLPGAGLALADRGDVTPVADDRGPFRALDQEVQARADRQLAAERCRKRSIGFDTNCIDLAPGTRFEIEGHPRSDIAAPLLCTHFEIQGAPASTWTQTGEAVFATAEYRPVETTPRPRIAGRQSAVVVGPAGQEIHTDELGRVRAQFHWDRTGKLNEQSSGWMRVSQAWAGRGYGKIVLPRIGQEVMVSYLEGDPDLPIVTGRSFNTVNTLPSENELPRYDARSTWMSDSSPHADNSFNVIRFEDRKEQEHVYTQAQRDQQKLVKRHETERTGQNRAELVGHDRRTVVAETDAVLVGAKYSLQMIAPPTAAQLKIRELGKPEVTPLATKIEMVDRKILCTSGQATVVLDGPDAIFEAKSAITFKAGGNVIVHGGPNIHLNPAGGGDGQGKCLQAGSSSGAPFVQKS